jgi:hypothetical protein
VSVPPLFIVGCPRSGTTLLTQLLKESRWGCRSESHFIAKYYKRLPRYGDLEVAENRAKLLKDILGERPVMQWKLGIDPAEFTRDPATADYPTLVDRLCTARVNKWGLTAWGDKTPHYIFEMHLLDRLFPEALFLNVIRDGRDVALSLLEKPWGPKNTYACAAFWARCTMETPALRRLRQTERLMDVRYEQLLAEPEKTMRAIYEFLGEPFDAEKLGPMLSGVKRDNFDKWRREMSARQLRTFEGVAGDTLERLGYERSTPARRLGLIPRLAGWTDNAVRRAIFLFRLNTWDAFRIRFLGAEPFGD